MVIDELTTPEDARRRLLSVASRTTTYFSSGITMQLNNRSRSIHRRQRQSRCHTLRTMLRSHRGRASYASHSQKSDRLQTTTIINRHHSRTKQAVTAHRCLPKTTRLPPGKTNKINRARPAGECRSILFSRISSKLDKRK